MPFLVEENHAGDDQEASRWQIVSLKRMLDFDRAVPIPPAKVNSLDYLSKLFREATVGIREACDGCDLRCAVAVPPCFSQRQRSAISAASTRAGFAQVRLLDDTLAGLLASRNSIGSGERILVYSWGGSAFSANLYQFRNNTFRSIGQDGDRNLGGDDLDAFILDSLLSAVAEKAGRVWEKMEYDFLVSAAQGAEKAKRLLANGDSVSIPLINLLGASVSRAEQQQTIELKSNTCEEVIACMIGKTVRHVETVLETAHCSQPDEVLLMGGMTLLPGVRRALEDRFNVPFHQTPDDAVAIGSVLYGGMLADNEWCKKKPASENRDDSPMIQQTEKTDKRWADHFIPLLNAAQRQDKQGELEEAVNTFDRLFIELGKFSSTLYRRLAARYDEEGRLDEAFDILNRAYQRDWSNNSVAMDFEKICVKRSYHEYSNKNYKSTLKYADLGISAIKRLPQGTNRCKQRLAEVVRFRALSLLALGYIFEAEKAMAESVSLDSKENTYQKELALIREEIKEAKRSSSARSKARKKHHIGANSLCPCGSGKKYKRCCGKR